MGCKQPVFIELISTRSASQVADNAFVSDLKLDWRTTGGLLAKMVDSGCNCETVVGCAPNGHRCGNCRCGIVCKSTSMGHCEPPFSHSRAPLSGDAFLSLACPYHPCTLRTAPYMSSGGRHVHRRRSHSASSPIRGPHLSDDPKWRWAAKRARPSYPRSPSYGDFPGYGAPPEKWDVDQWRRGKRARKNTTVSMPQSASVRYRVSSSEAVTRSRGRALHPFF